MRIKSKNLFLIMYLSGAGVPAQRSPSAVIEDSLEAIGGRKEIAKVRSLQAVAVPAAITEAKLWLKKKS